MTVLAKGPSFFEYFRSFYYEDPKTYSSLLSVDDEELRSRLYQANARCDTCSINHREVHGVLYDPSSFGFLTLSALSNLRNTNYIQERGIQTQWSGAQSECLLSKREETIRQIKD